MPQIWVCFNLEGAVAMVTKKILWISLDFWSTHKGVGVDLRSDVSLSRTGSAGPQGPCFAAYSRYWAFLHYWAYSKYLEHFFIFELGSVFLGWLSWPTRAMLRYCSLISFLFFIKCAPCSGAHVCFPIDNNNRSSVVAHIHVDRDEHV